jgi:CheY-like chemotaxis protein
MEESPCFHDKKILVVDDEELNFLMIKDALEDSCVNVTWARVGQEAIDLVESGEQYDIILMDMSMPVLDGYETTARIKKINSSIPVIAQTAYSQPEDEAKCMEAGCDDYLSKPVSIGELLEKIIKHL